MAVLLTMRGAAVLFVIFFEVGLFSSYTTVTAEAPNIPGLIDMQIQKITSFFSYFVNNQD